jgi:uncharacterized protein (DUF362 family)
MTTNAERGSASLVAISQIPSCSYARRTGRDDAISDALSRAAAHLQWSGGRGPFGALIPPGARVLIKPNLVLHSNTGTGGLEPLVSHGSLISAVVEAALLADAGEVVVGDAPLQSCDFSSLLASTGLDVWADETMKRDSRFKGIRDFRRTTCAVVHGIRKAEEDLQSEDRFTLFDLGRDSLLEPVSNGEERFRVTWYDPRLMARTHRPGHHQFLVAKEVLEADVVINLPKLKTHKKAGITCALKNLIGINGNKEYLPHHRLGGSETGGDCYPGASKLKRAREYVMDRQNLTSSMAAGVLWHGLDSVLSRMSLLQGDRIGVEGSWSGNDTIWRTCLDLNRILLYGQLDGSMADQRQRRVVHVVDAVIAGQGDGPLSPDPLPLGVILAGNNAVAVDWVAAHFLAYDPFKIPLLRHAFGDFRWPLSQFSNAEVRVTGDLGEGSPAIVASQKIPVAHPPGWRDASSQIATIETQAVAGSHGRGNGMPNNDVSDG